MKVPVSKQDSYQARFRVVLYTHCLLVICLGGLAYCEVILERPAAFEWLCSFPVGRVVYAILYFSPLLFTGFLAEFASGRISVWRTLALLLVDLVLAIIRFAI